LRKGDFKDTNDFANWSQEMEDYCVKDVEVTKKLAIFDISQTKFGVSTTISENIMRLLWNKLTDPPLIFGLKNVPVPSSAQLAKQVYPSSMDVAIEINSEFNLTQIYRALILLKSGFKINRQLIL
jgi:hypothetical protein